MHEAGKRLLPPFLLPIALSSQWLAAAADAAAPAPPPRSVTEPRSSVGSMKGSGRVINP